MLAISVQQPLAWFIFMEFPLQFRCDILNRRNPTDIRGNIYIHASEEFNMAAYERIIKNKHFGVVPHIPKPENFKLGGTIGMVELVDCVTHHDSLWFKGPYGYVLSRPDPDAFFPCPGQEGFFEVKFS